MISDRCSPGRRWLVAVTIYSALTALLTWPVVRTLTTYVAGFPGRDSLQYTWALWWSRHAWLAGHSATQVDLLFFPWGGEHLLLGVTPMLEWLAFPLHVFLSPTTVYNVVFLLCFLFTALANYALAYELTQHHAGALLAGVIFAFFPNRMGHALSGHLTQLASWWVPMAVLFLWLCIREPGWRWALLGGLWAVSVTDVVQFLVMFPICLLLIPLSLRAVGGFGELAAGSPEGYLSFPSKNLPWYMFAVSLLTLIHGQNTNPNAQRYFSASDEREARKVSLLCSVLAVVGVLFWAIPPMCARIMNIDLSAMQGLKPAESSFVSMSMYVLPHGLLGLLIAAMFAATMSSLDSTYNVMSAVISKDLGQRVFDRSISDRHLLRLGQVVTLIIGLIVMSFSLVISRAEKGVFNTMLELGVLTGVPLAAPMLLGFLYRKAPSWAGLFTFICTGATALLFVPEWGGLGDYLHWEGLGAYVMEHSGYSVWYAVTGLSQVGVAVATFFISPLLFRDREPVRQRIAGFFKKLDTPVDVEKEVPPSTVDTRGVARFIGMLALVLGGLVMLFVFIPGSARGRLVSLSAGGCIFGFGVWLRLVGRKRHRSASPPR